MIAMATTNIAIALFVIVISQGVAIVMAIVARMDAIAAVANRLAQITKDADDISAADLAVAELRDHRAKQRAADKR